MRRKKYETSKSHTCLDWWTFVYLPNFYLPIVQEKLKLKNRLTVNRLIIQLVKDKTISELENQELLWCQLYAFDKLLRIIK